MRSWSCQDFQMQQDYFHNGIRGQQWYPHQYGNYHHQPMGDQFSPRPSGSNNIVRNDSYVGYLQDAYMQSRKSPLLTSIKNLEDQVNSITNQSESSLLLRNIEKIMNVDHELIRLPKPNLLSLDGIRILNGEEYMVQYHVPGEKCMMYWSQGGLCYFVDCDCSFMELASNQYRNMKIGEALLDGVLIHREKKNVFVINDIAMKSNKSCRGAWLEERAQVAKEVMGNLGNLEKAPISIVFNPPKMMNEINWQENLSQVKMGENDIPCNGWIIAPTKTKFQFSQSNPAFVWSPSLSSINKETFLASLQY